MKEEVKTEESKPGSPPTEVKPVKVLTPPRTPPIIHIHPTPAEDTARPMMIDAELFDCPLCQAMLYDPLTTSCGHNFCKDCILRAMDHDNKCPLCRAIINVTSEHGVNILIQQILKTHFGALYDTRKKEHSDERRAMSIMLPLFLLGDMSLFPQMALPLHIFEPRYRLMLRRCLESNKRFGIVPRLDGKLADVGCVALIENHYVLPDGRSLVATQGERRFKILSATEQDGYVVAKVEFFDDLPEDPSKANEMLAKTVEAVKSKFGGEVLKQIQTKYGEMPKEASALSWWLAAILPMTTKDKVELNKTRTAFDRLQSMCKFLSTLRARKPTTATGSGPATSDI